MKFILSEEDRLLADLFKKFTEEYVTPLAAMTDEEEKFPLETVKKMGQLGMMGVPFPTKYGGAGGTIPQYIKLVEELAVGCATTSIIVSAHASLCAAPIFENGNEAQKQKFLIPLSKGEKLGAFALTEPDAGTDATSQKTTATKDGDHYILNGSKVFITNAAAADIFIIIAATDKDAGTRGISAFIVETGTPGMSIGKNEKTMGIRGSSTCEISFSDCRIPAENLLGMEGRGFSIAMKTLDGGRIGVAAQALGIAQGAYDATAAYVKERKLFGRKLSQFQNTQFVLADLKTKIEAARLLVYRAADKKENKEKYAVDAAMAKLFASELAMEVTTKAVQLFGGYGYTREYPVERMMRDAKITEIYEGTSEVQKMVIAASELK